MVKAKQDRRKRDIKSKLMAAIAMLLVSSIMMVSSTYAWFTLSTAPEVTGISTAVGANGNLEIALLNTTTAADMSQITSAVGDSMVTDNKSVTDANITWGNLVDLGNGNYGLEQITLYPSELNVIDATAGTFSNANILKTPVYGFDGRVSALNPNTLTALLGTDGDFPVDTTIDPRGVRAIGTSATMTAQQSAYRTARGAAASAMEQAKTLARQSLFNNGSILANVAVAHGLDPTATHSVADVKAMLKIVDDLRKDGGILDQIDTAYIQYLYAYAIGKNGVDTEAEFKIIKGIVEGSASASALLTTLEGTITDVNAVGVLSSVATPIEALEDTKANVEQAYTNLTNLVYPGGTEVAEGTTFTWDQIRPSLNLLADSSKMKINDMDISYATQNKQALIDSYLETDNLILTVATGGGVYADVADHCGNFEAEIRIEGLSYSGINLDNFPAYMHVRSSINPSYLSQAGTAVPASDAPTSTAGAKQTLTNFYGYIIDMAFRTNAANSDLLLQDDPVDRIYENTQGVTNDEGTQTTMGGGSYMSFTSQAADFSVDQIKELMKSIRVIFFTPGDSTNTILAEAKLDVENGESTGSGWKATLRIYDAETTTYSVATGYSAEVTADGVTVTPPADVASADALTKDKLYVQTTKKVNVEGDNPDTDVDETSYTTTEVVYTALTSAAVGTYADGMLYSATTSREETGIITSLDPNTATGVSVLVYLDGTTITNADVASSASKSLVGEMNLQFASSATLVPMDYADLKGQEIPTTNGSGTATN